jgi:hypothetical protein
MRKVQREQLMDLATYDGSRAEIRPRILEVKRKRRVHVAGVLTFLFENASTIRYQIQEMIRAERIEDEAAIRHELDTYNELLGGPGELGVSLLIEIAEPAERDVKLREWLALPAHLYAKLDSGEKVRARFDARQVGTDRLSSVQYVKFDVKGALPVAIGCDLPGFDVEAALDEEQRAALREDLASDS